MIDMGIRPSGDVDTDFVAMMVPHHQGAIDMALAVKTLDTGPISNHVNIVRNANGMFAYVTIGGLNEVKVFRTDDFEQVATIPTGKLPHGVWPSGDGTRVYVGLENEDKVAAIDTLKNEVIATSPIGQAPQALVYVPDAVPAASGANNSAMTRMMVVPEGLGTSNLRPLGVAGQSAQLWLAPPGAKQEEKAPTSVSLSDQGLVQVLEAAVTGLEPGKPYLLALATEPSGTGALEPLQGFMTNPAGAAIVNAIGPIRQVVRGEDQIPRRYLVILPGTPDNHGAAVQVQRE
jgi:YVTN family beta-propeller protein